MRQMKKNKILNECNIYTALWVVYYLQGAVAVYQRGSIISQLVLAILMAFSLIRSVEVLKTYRIPQVLKALNVLLLIVPFYGVIGLIVLRGTQYDPFSFWKVFLISFLPIYVYYGFTKEGYISNKWLSAWFFIFLGSVLVSYYGQRSMLLGYYEDINLDRTDFVNNVGYRFLALIPLVVFLRKMPIKLASLAVISVFLLLSFKRGAILIGGISILVFYFRELKNYKIKKSYLYFVAVLFIIFIAVFYSNNLINNEYANDRLAATLEGDTSGRNELYGFFWQHILNEQSFIRLFFGYGAMGTRQLNNDGMMAHNDWLELGIDMGVLGVIVYLIFWISFYKDIKKYSYNKQSQTALILLFVILFGKTLFSMSYSDITIYLSCVFGYSLAVGCPPNSDRKRLYNN